MADGHCPVLRPSCEEFADFLGFARHVERVASRCGVAKVIPPAEWRPEFEAWAATRERLIAHPIRQCISGGRGVFRVDIVEHRAMTVAEFEAEARRRDGVGVGRKRRRAEGDGYEERQRSFWRGLGPTMEPPIYGADVPGSLFVSQRARGRAELAERLDPTAEAQRPPLREAWNVGALPSLLALHPHDIAGVTTPMLYLGMAGALFAWHVEDAQLASINFLHRGEPKVWYAVAPSDARRFESVAASSFAEDQMRCKEYLRHKTSLLSPSFLARQGIRVGRVLQHAGEFVITCPGAYHCGFNLGFNVAEATNFATPEWVPRGLKAGRCLCAAHSVTVDAEAIAVRWRVLQRRQRGGAAEAQGGGAWGTWRFSCACGATGSSELPREAWPEGLMFQCDGCQVWTHVLCNHPQAAGPEDLGETALCLRCAGSAAGRRKRRRPRREGDAVRVRQRDGTLADAVVVRTDHETTGLRVHYVGARRKRDEWIAEDSPRIVLGRGE